MKELDARAFARLFEEAYRKCFADSFTSPLTESESHHFSVEISESTGREIGWKSLKNYSHYLLGKPQGKPENPSNQTLDALARYVASAPASNADQRPNGKRHYPYWFRYREAFHQSQPPSTDARNVARSRRSIVLLAVTLAIALAGVLIVLAGRGKGTDTPFVDEFDSLADVALAARGWSLLSIDTAHWAQRGAKPGHLSLYSLTGDNWPHAGTVPGIKNLLVRDAPLDCFGAEVRLTSFFPKHDWQQAGVILLEDTHLSERVSAYRSVTTTLPAGFRQRGKCSSRPSHPSGAPSAIPKRSLISDSLSWIPAMSGWSVRISSKRRCESSGGAIAIGCSTPSGR